MKAKGKNKSTIFRIFLVPLIAIMLVQSAITIGTPPWGSIPAE